MGSQQFCLRWNNHQTNLLTNFDQLLEKEALVDVTLACEGLSVKAHKMVLSACSPFFRELFLTNPCQHPIVILKDIPFFELKSIVQFMYKGEVNISQEQLPAFLKTAEALKVRGLAEVAGDHQPIPEEQPAMQTKEILPAAEGSDPAAADATILPGSPVTKRKRARPRRRSRSGSGESDNEEDNVETMVAEASEFSNVDGIKVEAEEQMQQLEERIESHVTGNLTDLGPSPNLRDGITEKGGLEQEPMNEMQTEQMNSENSNEAAWISEHKVATVSESSNSVTLNQGEEIEGEFGKRSARQHYKDYPQENMDQAVEAVLFGKMSSLQASKFYRVPNTTLRRYVSRLQYRQYQQSKNTDVAAEDRPAYEFMS